MEYRTCEDSLEVTEVISSNACYTMDEVISAVHQRWFTMILVSDLYSTSIHTSCAIICFIIHLATAGYDTVPDITLQMNLYMYIYIYTN